MTAKTKLKRCKFKLSVAKHQVCFTTKLQGQNLETFSHSAVTLIAYLQHTVNTNKTCVNNALLCIQKKLTPSITQLKKLIARQQIICFASAKVTITKNPLVWHFSAKNWRYGFEPAKEALAWHTVSLPITDMRCVTTLSIVLLCICASCGLPLTETYTLTCDSTAVALCTLRELLRCKKYL